MMEALRPYILSFIPLFVAVDAIANIPIFLSLVEHSSKPARKKIVLDAVNHNELTEKASLLNEYLGI